MKRKAPLRRIGKDYDSFRRNVKASSPLLNKVPLTDIDNIIAKKMFQKKDIIFSDFNIFQIKNVKTKPKKK